ncbi:MAG: DUF2064 domain-containing protein [Sphingobacteriales bacterium]|nr:DUF2064 domain-containing protein [Sphingobacteriales bacterium]
MKKTAIILFAHLPEFEAKTKRFSGLSSQKVTQKISKYLTNHFYQLSKKTEAEVFWVDTFHQQGESFGERISNAFADVYSKGFENVICIGNDCPDLKLSELQKAIEITSSGKVILGPTTDGGAYLIGIPKALFQKEKFEAIQWQSSQTYQQLLNIFKFSAEIEQIGTKIDLDCENDLNKLDHTNVIARVILQIIRLFQNQNCISQIKTKVDFLFISLSYLKGPPCLA